MKQIKAKRIVSIKSEKANKKKAISAPEKPASKEVNDRKAKDSMESRKDNKPSVKIMAEDENNHEPVDNMVAQETKAAKMEAFYYNISSLEKSAMDPKGTMLVAKYKQHEIGIHVDPKLSSLLFSYYPKEGKGEMINIPVSINDIISFISQKAS